MKDSDVSTAAVQRESQFGSGVEETRLATDPSVLSSASEEEEPTSSGLPVIRRDLGRPRSEVDSIPQSGEAGTRPPRRGKPPIVFSSGSFFLGGEGSLKITAKRSPRRDFDYEPSAKIRKATSASPVTVPIQTQVTPLTRQMASTSSGDSDMHPFLSWGTSTSLGAPPAASPGPTFPSSNEPQLERAITHSSSSHSQLGLSGSTTGQLPGLETERSSGPRRRGHPPTGTARGSQTIVPRALLPRQVKDTANASIFASSSRQFH